MFVFVDQYRGDKAPQHERREQGRHPVESKESARIVVYIYIFNREREREIVRRRQSSIVSIIFSFFEIILFSLPLSLFLFVVVARASEAFKKKKNLCFAKKNPPKSSALFPRASSPISPPITLPNSIIGTKTAANQSRPKEELAFFCSKTTKETFIFHFQTVFWNGIRGKTRKTRARAKNDKQTKNYHFNKIQRKNN